jgi:hypothetical protein
MRSTFAFVATLLISAAAHAQLFRAYLAPTGSDSNPCTLPAPCRLLPAALAAVASGGEIWMLDSANYNTGPVSITKSVTILAVPGAVGSVLSSGGNAIDIATAGVKVALRNLVIVPFPGAGANGVVMTNGALLTIENCLIANMPFSGISVLNTATLRITDSTIRDNGNFGLFLTNGVRAAILRTTISGQGVGVLVQGTLAGTTTSADIADSSLDSNTTGLQSLSTDATAAINVTLRSNQIIRSATVGVAAQSNAGATVSVAASSNMIAGNGTGMASSSAGTKVLARGNTVSNNGTGFFIDATSLFESAGDNALRNNGINKVGTVALVTTE